MSKENLWPQVGDPVKVSSNRQITVPVACEIQPGEHFVWKAEKADDGRETGNYMLRRVDWHPTSAEADKEK